MKMLIFWANINKEKVTVVLYQYIDFQCAFKELLTLRLCFKLVHLRHDIAHNSTRFITCSKFILQILTLNNFFIKNYCLSCTLLPSCDQFRNPSRPLGAPIVLWGLSEISFLESFTQHFKKVCPCFTEKASVLVLLKKYFTNNFFWVLLQKYSQLGNKNVSSKSGTLLFFII